MNSRIDNIKRFEELINSIDRDGKEDLLNFLRKSDFYTAPASTRFHLCCEGGLLQHSLNVYDCMMAKKESPMWRDIMQRYSDDSLSIMSLLHDVCKVGFYVKGTKNQKNYDKEKVAAAEHWQVKHDQMGDYIWECVNAYTIDDKMPLGHGEKSVIIIQQYIKLMSHEVYAIRWHMGFSESEANYNSLSMAMEKYPIVLALYEADLEATKLIEVKE